MRHAFESILRLSSTLTLLTMALLIAMASAANAQSAVNAIAKTELAKEPSNDDARTDDGAQVAAPLFNEYKGIHIGMSADEVRNTLDHLKNSGERQDFFVFSDTESAQVYYDAQGKVTAVSVDYVGGVNAPSPQAVLGEDIQPRANGSMYLLKRYPAAGYWLAYSRTSGENPIVTVTIQKMP